MVDEHGYYLVNGRTYQFAYANWWEVIASDGNLLRHERRVLDEELLHALRMLHHAECDRLYGARNRGGG